MQIADHAGPIWVTIAYILVYFGFVINVARVKSARAKDFASRGEKFDRYFSQDREMLAADRIQLNALEQMPTFLTLLWLNAVFVGSLPTTIAGGVYVAARVAYPFLMGARLGRGIPASILVATLPGYLVHVWFAGALIWALVTA
ncbi:MAG: MAPEG family protein [Myxococcota bacterium]